MANFLICTDVAARGIDIRGIPFVINYTLPDDKANYLHRIGRIGRAERNGASHFTCFYRTGKGQVSYLSDYRESLVKIQIWSKTALALFDTMICLASFRFASHSTTLTATSVWITPPSYDQTYYPSRKHLGLYNTQTVTDY
ncbi:ATP-dependent helicase, DEAD/DEAH-box family [Trichinella spiralis]|uniref:ATP-dependent helicase, DEAD/DEAH-box family n=1 Tax=Trichinella spiralis TaxID=6334 RepID=UPI0001EFD4B9|nr:ATP-dependent helicase, DEAD/DEAH-box family [Trichinella spiralis]